MVVTSAGNCSNKFALVLIDLQPEWYSRSHISRIFPQLGNNVAALLAHVRKLEHAEVVHVRSKYVHDGSEAQWSKWVAYFRELNPDKDVDIDGTNSVEDFAAEVSGEKYVFLFFAVHPISTFN